MEFKRDTTVEDDLNKRIYLTEIDIEIIKLDNLIKINNIYLRLIFHSHLVSVLTVVTVIP